MKPTRIRMFSRMAEIQIATLNVERSTICFPSRPIAEHGIKSTTAVSVAVVICILHLLQNSRPVFVWFFLLLLLFFVFFMYALSFGFIYFDVE